MDYLFTSRSKRSDGTFSNNHTKTTRYLKLPSKKAKIKKGYILPREKWVDDVIKEAKNNQILIYVHGFNTHQNEMIRRHRKIRKQLRANGFTGVVVSFDWPSDYLAPQYPTGVRVAQKTAAQLVLDGIIPLMTASTKVKIHILAHSMGSLVVRHGFALTANAKVRGKSNWKIGRVMLVAADIHAVSVTKGNPKSRSLMARCQQLTNYYSLVDEVLKLSQFTFWPKYPRLGQEGAPKNVPSHLVDIYCRKHYITHQHSYPKGSYKSHTWYFDDALFYKDVSLVLAGKLAPNKFPTRVATSIGDLALWKR